MSEDAHGEMYEAYLRPMQNDTNYLCELCRGTGGLSEDRLVELSHVYEEVAEAGVEVYLHAKRYMTDSKKLAKSWTRFREAMAELDLLLNGDYQE